MDCAASRGRDGGLKEGRCGHVCERRYVCRIWEVECRVGSNWERTVGVGFALISLFLCVPALVVDLHCTGLMSVH